MRAIIIGANGVGKTTLFQRLTGLPLNEDERSTRGVLQTPRPLRIEGEDGPLLLDLLEISDDPRIISLYALSSPDFALIVYNAGCTTSYKKVTKLLYGQLYGHHDRRLPWLLVENMNPKICTEDKKDHNERLSAVLAQLAERNGWPLLKVNLRTGAGMDRLQENLYRCAISCSRSKRSLHPRSFNSVLWTNEEYKTNLPLPRRLIVHPRSFWNRFLAWVGVYQYDLQAYKVRSFDAKSDDWPFKERAFPVQGNPHVQPVRRFSAEDGNLALYAPDVILKAGRAAELCNLIFLACNTGVRVPRVYQARLAGEGPAFMLLERIDGENLEKAITSQSLLSKVRIYWNVRGWVQEMRRFQSDFPGPLDGSAVEHGIIFDNLHLESPFLSSYDFAFWAIRQQDIERRLRRLKYPKQPEVQISKDFRYYEPLPPYSFCHYDLDWRNVMLTKDGQLVLIDFVTSGFYDPGLEHAPMRVAWRILPNRGSWRQRWQYFSKWWFLWFLFGRYPQAERFHMMVWQALLLHDRHQPLA